MFSLFLEGFEVLIYMEKQNNAANFRNIERSTIDQK